jgi:hypothetical protein
MEVVMGRISVHGTGDAVSPILPDFYNYIEPEIRPVVAALRRRGYFTVSSCAGHPGTDSATRHVVVAFRTTAGASRFRREVGARGIPLVRVVDQEFLDFRAGDFRHDQRICENLFAAPGPYTFVRIEIGRTTGEDQSPANLFWWALDRLAHPLYRKFLEHITKRVAGSVYELH